MKTKLDDYTKAKDALKTLSQCFAETWNEPESVPMWKKIGNSISRVVDHSSDVFELLYSFLEAWNHHTENSILVYLFPAQFCNDQNFYYREFIANKILEKNLSREIPITGYEDGEWKVVGTAKVVVTVEYEELN